MNEFGNSLKNLRKSQQITLSQLSEIVSKSIVYLSDLELGRKKPLADKNLLMNIETALDIRSGYLLGLAEQTGGKPESMPRQSKLKPRLAQALLRADRDLSEDELESLLSLLMPLK